MDVSVLLQVNLKQITIILSGKLLYAICFTNLARSPYH